MAQNAYERQLMGAFRGSKFSPVRTVTTTMSAGTAVYAYDTSEIANPQGAIILAILPATHNSWVAYPRTSDLHVVNSGAAQSFTFRYIVVGT